MPEDGGKSEPDSASGDSQEGGNQQGAVLSTKDIVDEDVQQPGAGDHHGGVPGGHRCRPRVGETRAAQIAPKSPGDLPIRKRAWHGHARRRRGHGSRPLRWITRPAPRWTAAFVGRTARGRGRNVHRACRGVQHPARGPRQARRLDQPDARWTAGGRRQASSFPRALAPSPATPSAPLRHRGRMWPSSSTSTRGSPAMARAIAMRCAWPPDKRRPRSPTWVSNPSRVAPMKSAAAAMSDATGHLMLPNAFASEPDVVSDGSMKEHGVLEHDANMPAHLRRTHCANVLPVKPDFTGAWLEESQQEVYDGRLSGAARTHDRRLLSRLAPGTTRPSAPVFRRCTTRRRRETRRRRG